MTITTTLLPLLFLLLAFTIKLKFSIASVLDTDGKWVENGGDYYILPCFNGEGGGVTYASIGVKQPLAVVQSASKNCLGLSVSISNSLGTMIILTDENVSIKFTNNSSTWMIVMDELAKVWYVAINSAEGYLSHQIKMGSFQIKEYDLGYKFVFCSATNSSTCEDVGIYTDSDGKNRLSLYGGAFAVKFQNADKALVAYE
ncbi:factor Xa inhibitor BuXI-like [Gastrolobium bilobum]|uniref:factor Xa inhibitor BuXI-like n=1 Tax=Gastrolobium bilobum TaxID=150636 RepID=UPI002AB2D848|nr:factor Xa inhibitor BuXI-like [Gastrolobium bilobum]